MRTTTRKMISTPVDIISCDACDKRIEEYGSMFLTLKSIVGPWKDDVGELVYYDFCNQECLQKFLDTHKQQDVARAEFVER